MYDVIIIGLGAMGSATAYHAARQGHTVLGLDTNARHHSNGSSHGRSRIIRTAYAEGPQYVELVQRAFTLWRQLEHETGRPLLTMTGGLYIGLPTSRIVSGVLRSAAVHGLPCDYLTPAEVGLRFPGFRLPAPMVAVYEAAGGILDAQACVDAHLAIAAQHGAQLHYNEPVVQWSVDKAEGIRVETAKASYRGARLVIAAGGWTGGLLADLGLPLTVSRQVNAYFEPTRPDFNVGRCPFYLLEVPEGTYYGLPSLPGQGLKTGCHDSGEVSTPQTIRRSVDPWEIDALRGVLNQYLPGAAGPLKATTTCIYTMTPDEDFLIDYHPRYPQVTYVSACSGHGFKFSAAIGEALAGMALGGVTSPLIRAFSAARLGIPQQDQDPGMAS